MLFLAYLLSANRRPDQAFLRCAEMRSTVRPGVAHRPLGLRGSGRAERAARQDGYRATRSVSVSPEEAMSHPNSDSDWPAFERLVALDELRLAARSAAYAVARVAWDSRLPGAVDPGPEPTGPVRPDDLPALDALAASAVELVRRLAGAE